MSNAANLTDAKRIAEMVWMLALQGEGDALEALTVEVEGYLTRAVSPRRYRDARRRRGGPLEPISLQAHVFISSVDV